MQGILTGLGIMACILAGMVAIGAVLWLADKAICKVYGWFYKDDQDID